MKEILEKLDYKGGKITYNEFNIDPLKSFEAQEWDYQEDLFQAVYQEEKYVIDIGYYPSMKVNGKFRLRVIKDYDWQNPILDKNTKSLKILIEYLKQSIDFVSQL